MNHIWLNPLRTAGAIDRNIFGGFAEHMHRCIYGGIYDPGSPQADDQGLRLDVLDALRRQGMPVVRYPGGNFVSGYRWRDGVGPREERPARLDLAWHALESNHFGTDEFIRFCRLLEAEPFLVVNCGDGDLREARDWLEYCNGAQPTEPVKLRQAHGFAEPHNVRYWGIGNEVDGPWQIGHKTAAEYARACTEFAKAMKLVDPTIKLVAAGASDWTADVVDTARLLLQQAGNLIDYLDVHWYIGLGMDVVDFPALMTTSELLEERLSAMEGLIRIMRLNHNIEREIHLAVCEYNVLKFIDYGEDIEAIFNLQDMLVIAQNLNAFLRHAHSVRMANISEIVNMGGPIRTNPDGDGLVLQTTWHALALYSRLSGDLALDAWLESDASFSGGDYSGVPVLDVAATRDQAGRQITLFVINRSADAHSELTIHLEAGRFDGAARANILNGPQLDSENTFDTPDAVQVRTESLPAQERSLTCTLEPHSLTALELTIRR